MKDDPLFRRIRRHAERRLVLEPGTSTAKRLEAFKEFLRLEDEMLGRYHGKGDSGLRVATSRAIAIDVMIEHLFAQALDPLPSAAQWAKSEVCVVALGGYGRAELCPLSDIDIMFLLGGKLPAAEQDMLKKALTDTVLYILWDLGLKVGHSTRTVREAIEESRGDNQTLNSLLEARRICGSPKVYERFGKSFRRHLRHINVRAYLDERLADQKDRRGKFGGTVFLQEPDIKNGVGGLRDYQNNLWLGRLVAGAGTVEELVEKGYLSAREAEQLDNAYSFLLRVRNDLHFRSRRPTDLLSLDVQPKVAWQLGYRWLDIFQRVERFMRDYYRHAWNLHQTSLDLEQRLARTVERPPSFSEVLASRRYQRESAFDGFLLREGELSYAQGDLFEEDPERLIRLFRHIQQHNAHLSFELREKVKESLDLIGSKMRHSASAARSFRSILQEVGNVHPTLLLMHELGVLGKFMPEWQGLTCLVQHEYYHRYTADIHVLKTIRELDQVFAREGETAQKYHKALQDTGLPGLLYLILLLHDIGKAKSIQGHAEIGAEMADSILERLQVASAHRDIIVFIIRQHLEMARFWQRYDIDDPRTIELFARQVGDAPRLHYLFVHTFCDARGTADGLWNSYKDSLHTHLYKNTLAYLSHDVDGERRAMQQHIMTSKENVSKALPRIDPDEIEAHYSLLPERYFVHTQQDEVVLHLQMVHQLLQRINEAESVGSLVPVVEWRDDRDLGLTVVHVVTWDRPGLFYKLAGAFSVAGVSISSSRAISRSDHILIDTFYVRSAEGGPVRSKAARESFDAALEDALVRNKDLLPQIIEQAKKAEKPAYLKKTDRLSAPLPPHVDVYHELSLRRTIIELQASDQIGLLYRLARAIYDHGFDITFARVATERGVAMDTFYIESIDKAQSTGTANLLALRETLNGIIAPPEESAPGKAAAQ